MDSMDKKEYATHVTILVLHAMVEMPTNVSAVMPIDTYTMELVSLPVTTDIMLPKDQFAEIVQLVVTTVTLLVLLAMDKDQALVLLVMPQDTSTTTTVLKTAQLDITQLMNHKELVTNVMLPVKLVLTQDPTIVLIVMTTTTSITEVVSIHVQKDTSLT